MFKVGDVTIRSVSGNELHLEYPGQYQRQTVELCLDCERRELYCQANPIIGSGVPMRQWHGSVQAWTIPCLKGEAAMALMEGLAEEAGAICDGYESVWNGSNHVAKFDDAATAAIESISYKLYIREFPESDQVNIWKAANWYQPINVASELGITAETTDEELADMADSEEHSASADGHDVEGILEHLTEVRDEIRRSSPPHVSVAQKVGAQFDVGFEVDGEGDWSSIQSVPESVCDKLLAALREAGFGEVSTTSADDGTRWVWVTVSQ